MIPWSLAILAAYFLGGIPFGYLIGRAKGVDIRQHGSRNIGATNVGRILGKGFGITCFILDLLKGALPVAIAGWWFNLLGKHVAVLSTTDMLLWLAVAFAAVIGHMFSPYLGLRGGKGVATAFGALLAMWNVLTIPALIAIAVWYAALRLFRYVSLASMLAAASVPLACALTLIPPNAQDIPLSDSLVQMSRGWPPLLVTVAIAAIVVYRHRTNIARLRAGTEPKAKGRARRGDTMEDHTP